MSALRSHLGLLCVLALTVALGLPALNWPAGILDEMILLVLPERILHGDLPYQDFSTVYGPTHWLALSGVLGATSVSLFAERMFGLAEHLLLVAGVYQLIRHEGRGLATTGAVVCSLLLFPLGLPAYAWIGFAALLTWALVALQADRVFLGGVLAGLALGFRPDTLLLVLAATVVLAWPQRRRLVLGGAVGLLPLLAVAGSAPREFVHDVAGRAINGGGQSRLPLPWYDSDQALLLIGLLVSVLLIVVSAAVTRDRLLVALALVAVLALPQGLQRAETVHFLYAAVLATPFLPLALTRLLARSAATSRRAPLLGGVFAGTVALLAGQGAVLHPLMASVAGEGPVTVEVQHAGRVALVSPSRADGLRAVLATVEAQAGPGDRILVWDANTRRPVLTDVTLYFLLRPVQRPFNVELSPGLSNAPGSRLADDVREADVLVLLTPTEGRRRANYPYITDGPADAQKEIRDSFCLAERAGGYMVMRRCA